MLLLTGRSVYDAIKLGCCALPASIKVVSYIDDSCSILPDIGLLISRAGLTTLLEMSALGIPAILFSSPNVTHHHVYLKLQMVSKKGAALTITEPELNVNFSQRVVTLMEDELKRALMAQASKRLGGSELSDVLMLVMTTLLTKRG